MAGFSQKYSGMNSGALPAGYTDLIQAPGRAMAAGLAMAGQGIAQGIQQMKEDKLEAEIADRLWQLEASRKTNPVTGKPGDTAMGLTKEQWDALGHRQKRAHRVAWGISELQRLEEERRKAQQQRDIAESAKQLREFEEWKRKMEGETALGEAAQAKFPAVPGQTIQGKFDIGPTMNLPPLPEERMPFGEAMARYPQAWNAPAEKISILERARRSPADDAVSRMNAEAATGQAAAAVMNARRLQEEAQRAVAAGVPPKPSVPPPTGWQYGLEDGKWKLFQNKDLTPEQRFYQMMIERLLNNQMPGSPSSQIPSSSAAEPGRYTIIGTE